MPFPTQPLSREQHEEDCDFTPDSESPRWIASPNISSVCNKLHIAIRLCYVTHVRCLTTEQGTSLRLSTTFSHLDPSRPPGQSVNWKQAGLPMKVRSLNSLRKQNQSEEECAWRKTGWSEPQARTVLPGVFKSRLHPHFFLNAPEVTPWFLLLLRDQESGCPKLCFRFFSLVEQTDNSISPGTGTDNPFKTAR